MERIIFIAIIVSASIYVIVRVYRKIKVIINLSRGKKIFDPALSKGKRGSCCECGSCPMSDRCEEKK